MIDQRQAITELLDRYNRDDTYKRTQLVDDLMILTDPMDTRSNG